ncbi:MAG: DUF2147 domain-containing protein [Chlorobi bacterium]|nr:DUF2147 domain-containing protein [Chlorobiota bacterium]
MKYIFATFFLLLGMQVWAQGVADKVVGKWYTDDKETIIEIYKQGNKYHGKIVWLKEPYENGKPKVDDDNPDPKLQNRPIMGLTLLQNFVYDRDKQQWNNGIIYDPKSGKTYDCYMWMESPNALNIKGYVLGMKFIGRKTIWTKAQ